MSKLLIDIGSTYFKVCEDDTINQYFRNFERNIFDDLQHRCGDILSQYNKEDVHICSSANGGLSTLIIGLTHSFSLKYATNIAYNAGINIIDTVLYSHIDEYTPPLEMIDVVIIVGGIDGVKNVFDTKLLEYLKQTNYHNIVYVGSNESHIFMQEKLENIQIMDNIITEKLQLQGEGLKTYLTNLYQQDIMGKEDIKHLYEFTANQIFSTPYIVNRAMGMMHTVCDVADPFILIDIGGATTDIHYSRDLVVDNIVSESEYDRLVFKKLGVFKSRDSLVFSAKNNEFVYELLEYLNVTENILEEHSDNATRILMQLSIFLVLYKTSMHHNLYINLQLEKLNSIVFTGGITKVLTEEEVEMIVKFFYKKLLHFHQIPSLIIDKDYKIWTLAIEGNDHVSQ
ncbi:MAG: glutamate mutase L [Campylobacterota bacterium]|nr:glutamate mutase L [Campylobacterota bacterium]